MAGDLNAPDLKWKLGWPVGAKILTTLVNGGTGLDIEHLLLLRVLCLLRSNQQATCAEMFKDGLRSEPRFSARFEFRFESLERISLLFFLSTS